MSFLAKLTEIVGHPYVIGPDGDQGPYTIDWRGRYKGRAIAVVKPGSTEQVSAVVRLCAEHRVAIVPQGGNTGLCGASIPRPEDEAIILRLDRMNRVRSISRIGDSISVDAGCILADIQAAADAQGRLFPMSLGAEGSCQIGGNLSTNAGGTGVLRYGTMRELTLGLEVVMPDGEILNSMTSLRKDNTGYDLKQLFIGAEGTLGVITGAVLKLFPKPQRFAVGVAMLNEIENALDLLALARTQVGDRLASFEILSKPQVELVAMHMPDVSIPYKLEANWYVLVELSDTLVETNLDSTLESLFAEAYEANTITDAVVASSEAQRSGLWRVRHSISEALKKHGYVVSHDSAVPLDRQPEFVRQCEIRIKEARPDAYVAMVGHMGDGNIHVMGVIPAAANDTPEQLKKSVKEINDVIDEVTAALGGSISAEHGIGVANLERLKRVTDPFELKLMHQVKNLFDPLGIMNPGKVLSFSSQ